MRCITVQHKDVYNTLKNGNVYRASYRRVSMLLEGPYRYMQNFFKWDSTPIFLGVVGYHAEFGGAKFMKNYVAIELEIPNELCKIQNYYNWSDFIYFNELPDDFVSDEFKDVNSWGDTILDINLSQDETVYQCTVEYLHPDWVTGVLEDLSQLEHHHDQTGGRNKLKSINYYKLKRDSKNHLTLGIYANKQYKYNVVRDEDLDYHIEYNETMRFGRLLYVDGERIYDGCTKLSRLQEYDEIAKEFFDNAKDRIDMTQPTTPYR